MHPELQPSGILLCDPREFDVIDTKNPFMTRTVAVDRQLARKQWEELRDAFVATGAGVVVMPGSAGCEDMVFCANTALTGLDASGVKRAVASHMTFPSRQPEVEPTIATLKALGYSDHQLPGEMLFEGGGDAVWHLGQRRIFGGSGYRSEPSAHDFVEQVFGCEVVPLILRSPQFYHLDTCLCVIDEATALVYRPALADESFALLKTYFSSLIEVEEEEALRFACNACAFAGSVVIEQSARRTIEALRERGFNVLPVDTSEFMKSGGSVYCMKQYLF